ncbi:unnamed protein product, partial [Didymodactylos carnosus]
AVQHDIMKQEVLAQNALPILIECIKMFSGDDLSYCLELMWAITFNNEVATTIKNDQALLALIKSLSASDHNGIKKTAEGIIWKLEKEAEFVSKQEPIESVKSANTSTSNVVQLINDTKTMPQSDEIKLKTQSVRGGESEQTTLSEPTKSSFRYDIMISYSHEEKELCYKIYDHLLKNNYRVIY